MGVYELDDLLVRLYVESTKPDASDARKRLREQMKEQLPAPAPTKIGAVVRTKPTPGSSKFRLWVLWANGLWMTPEDTGGNAYTTGEIGRITDVLSEGVDL